MKPKKTIITDYKDVEHTYGAPGTAPPPLYEVRVQFHEITYRGNTNQQIALRGSFVVPKSAVQQHDLFLSPPAVKNPESTLEDRLISLLDELGVQFEQ